MRIKNSLLNYLSGIATKIISLILNFISRTVFINILGISYLGVNGLMTNVLSLLNLAELGIGTAITFSLYKPIANNDNKKIIILMNFYKKAYRIIGIIVFLVGLILLLFIDLIIKDSGDIENLKLIFLIYILIVSFPYFINYKVTLINASQKGYLLAPTNVLFNLIIVLLQIIILIATKNFIFYLITNMIVLFVQTVYLNIKVTRLYPFLKTKSTEKLPKEEYNLILKNVKAMVFHKLGDFSINGTDNLIISAFLSVSVVGLYSNYAMIISSINAFIVLFFESITASMGNLIATSSDRKKLEVFNITNFISFWIYGFATICFYNLLNPTIEIWLGNKYLIAQEIILVVLFNYYLTGMRVPVTTVKSAAGIYDVDKFTPLTQAVINLVVSILLVQKFGLIGVFIGTLISSLVLPCWQRPYILYKYVFKTSSRPYFLEYIKYLSVIFGIILVTSWIINTFFLETTIMNYIARIIVCLLVPNLIIIICFYRSSVFREVIQILKSVLKGKSRWIKKSV